MCSSRSRRRGLRIESLEPRLALAAGAILETNSTSLQFTISAGGEGGFVAASLSQNRYAAADGSAFLVGIGQGAWTSAQHGRALTDGASDSNVLNGNVAVHANQTTPFVYAQIGEGLEWSEGDVSASLGVWGTGDAVGDLVGGIETIAAPPIEGRSAETESIDVAEIMHAPMQLAPRKGALRLNREFALSQRRDVLEANGPVLVPTNVRLPVRDMAVQRGRDMALEVAFSPSGSAQRSGRVEDVAPTVANEGIASPNKTSEGVDASRRALAAAHGRPSSQDDVAPSDRVHDAVFADWEQPNGTRDIAGSTVLAGQRLPRMGGDEQAVVGRSMQSSLASDDRARPTLRESRGWQIWLAGAAIGWVQRAHVKRLYSVAWRRR